MILFSAFVFLFGLTIGSFLNVLIYRLPRGLKVGGKNRSFCPHCRRILAWFDLIPLASFFMLKGRCRYCCRLISWRYPAVEFLTGLLFVACFLSFGLGRFDGFLSLSFWLTVVSLFLLLVFIDFDWFVIPDKILVALFILAVLYHSAGALFPFSDPVLEHLPSIFKVPGLRNFFFSAIFSGAAFALVVLVTKGKGMGLGDVKLTALIGLLFGFPAVLMVIYGALIVGTVWGLLMLAFFKANLKTKLPFGSILAGMSVIYIIGGGWLFSHLASLFFRLYI